MAKQVNDDAYWSHGDDTEPVSFVPGVDVDNNFKKFISDQNTKRRLRVENVVSSLISIVLTHLKKGSGYKNHLRIFKFEALFDRLL